MILSNLGRESFPCFGCPCAGQRMLDGLGDLTEAEVATTGGVVTAMSARTPIGASIMAGVTTGVLIWAITRILDGSKR